MSPAGATRIIATMAPRTPGVTMWQGALIIYITAPAFPAPYFGNCRARPPSLWEFLTAWAWALARETVRHPVQTWWRLRVAHARAWRAGKHLPRPAAAWTFFRSGTGKAGNTLIRPAPVTRGPQSAA